MNEFQQDSIDNIGNESYTLIPFSAEFVFDALYHMKKFDTKKVRVFFKSFFLLNGLGTTRRRGRIFRFFVRWTRTRIVEFTFFREFKSIRSIP